MNDTQFQNLKTTLLQFSEAANAEAGQAKRGEPLDRDVIEMGRAALVLASKLDGVLVRRAAEAAHRDLVLVLAPLVAGRDQVPSNELAGHADHIKMKFAMADLGFAASMRDHQLTWVRA